jgi:hypothetical protein
MLGQELRHLGLNDPRQQCTRTIAQNFGDRTSEGSLAGPVGKR